MAPFVFVQFVYVIFHTHKIAPDQDVGQCKYTGFVQIRKVREIYK